MNEESATRTQDAQDIKQLIADINILIDRIEVLRTRITLYLLLDRSFSLKKDFGLGKEKLPFREASPYLFSRLFPRCIEGTDGKN
jgi:hypothetical protein